MVSSRLLYVGVYWRKVAMEIVRSFNRAEATAVPPAYLNLLDMSCVSDLAVLLTLGVYLLVCLIPV